METGHGAVRLVDPDTGREYARLENPNQDRAFVSELQPRRDATRDHRGDSQSIHVWDLRTIREQLAKMGLDWDLPPYPPAPEVKETQPLRIQVELGDPAQLLRDREEATRRIIEQKRRALEANPNNAKACNNLAWALLTAPDALRDWKAALPLAQKAVQLDPGPMNRNTLGLAYYRAGRYREAVETLQPNLKDQVDWALPYDLYFLAMSHHQLGESAAGPPILRPGRPMVRRPPGGAQPVYGGIGCHPGRSRGFAGSERQGTLTPEWPPVRTAKPV